MNKLIVLFFIEIQRFKQIKRLYIDAVLISFNSKNENGNPNNSKAYLYSIKYRFSSKKC